ncbi:hypothetical protein HUZ36_13170 [Pseudoalteromonas sp. McH1-7]|uniref:hypothetical protein n=1 Tax=Pseudoalteromonas sp. McH1-7 TaxID=2745574 RepID=UPI001591D618|nr:hypothetical protein [Pseudoalteromonas sp. McH1-7]NUZ11731.1 hypothetical protein [Pseudoalteromonas sp. McH1-7]
MSNDNLTMTERLSQVATRANALCQTVEDQVGIIQSTLENKAEEVDQHIDSSTAELTAATNGMKAQVNSFIDSQFRAELPFFRITKNQELKINGSLTPGTKGIPDGYSCRNSNHYECEIVAYSEHGKIKEDKHPEIRAMYDQIQGGTPKYNQPDFAIVRVKALEVDDYPAFENAYSIYQGALPYNNPLTFGGWIKAESGKVRFTYPSDDFLVPTDDKWHEITRQSNMPSSGGVNYTFGPHIYLEKGASCLIALPSVVAGKVPANRWGYFEKPVFERQL